MHFKDIFRLMMTQIQDHFERHKWGHGGAVVIHSPPTSAVSDSNPGPNVGRLVVAYRWSAVYSTEP